MSGPSENRHRFLSNVSSNTTTTPGITSQIVDEKVTRPLNKEYERIQKMASISKTPENLSALVTVLDCKERVRDAQKGSDLAAKAQESQDNDNNAPKIGL